MSRILILSRLISPQDNVCIINNFPSSWVGLLQNTWPTLTTTGSTSTIALAGRTSYKLSPSSSFSSHCISKCSSAKYKLNINRYKRRSGGIPFSALDRQSLASCRWLLFGDEIILSALSVGWELTLVQQLKTASSKTCSCLPACPSNMHMRTVCVHMAYARVLHW